MIRLILYDENAPIRKRFNQKIDSIHSRIDILTVKFIR